MRLLIFSDLHGNQYVWRAFAERLREIRYDRLVFLGDIFGYYYGQKELLEALSLRQDLIWLRGNHDQFFLDLLAGKREEETLIPRYGSTYHAARRTCASAAEKLLASRDFSLSLELDGRRILFCHGTPEDPEAGRLYPKDPWTPELCGGYDTVICGHTHFRMVREGGGKLWLNAGSLGQPRDGNPSGALLFDTASGAFAYLDIRYDKTPLFREIEERDPELDKLKEILERERNEGNGG